MEIDDICPNMYCGCESSVGALIKRFNMAETMLREITLQIEAVELGCHGKHSQYSSMDPRADEICSFCGENQDAPGGSIRSYEPTKLAKKAHAILSLIEKK